MQIQPYLIFSGRCDEALEFYRKALGAEVKALMRFKEAPEPNMCGPESADKVMHSEFRIGQTTVMASDGMEYSGKPKFDGVSLALLATSDAEAERLFAALSDGGQVSMPLGQTFFASRFGMVSDRFGVSWMVVTDAAASAAA
jgi:PhnB protein